MQVTVPKEDKIEQFKHKKYLGLETYRKNGQPVFTPVWYVTDDSHLYIITDKTSGKVKRIHNNPYVQVVPVTPRGKPDGEWIEAEADIVQGPIYGEVKRLIDEKYGLTSKILAALYALVTRRRAGKNAVVLSIRFYSGGEL